MAIDPYSACPGGTGKKVKFCCADMLGELDKVVRMYEGEQRVACLDYIEKLESKFPGRPCLLAIKAQMLAELRRSDEYREVMATFLKLHPENPIPLADAALAAVQTQGPAAAVEMLQRAIEAIADAMPEEVYHAIGAMAQLLLAAGCPRAALGHYFLQISLNPRDEQPFEMLMRIMASPSLPLLLKDELHFAPAPDEARWKKEFDAALNEVSKGHWRQAAIRFAALAQKVPDAPAIWQNLACLRAWLADNAGAVEALRKYAALDMPFEAAVEADALAQLLDQSARQDLVDVVSVTYPLVDIEPAQNALSVSSQASEVPAERRRGRADEPPPRAIFLLLDQPLPRTGVGIRRDEIPQIVGTVELFGRETDREARLELIAYRTEKLAQAKQLVERLAAGVVGPAGEEQKIDEVSALRLALAANWHLPDDTPPEQVRELSAEHRRENLFERWPRLPLPTLDGKTPLEAAGDARYRLKLAALVLLLEMTAQQEPAEFDFDALRRQLGLPASEPIDPTTVDVERLSLARLSRIEMQKLADDSLVQVYMRAANAHAAAALRRAALEVVVRPSLKDKVDVAQAYGLLAGASASPSEAAGYFDLARAAAEAKGQSTVNWDLEELNLRLTDFDEQEVMRLIQHITREHLNEPGVRQALAQMLMAAGLIGPDGRPPAPAATPASAIVTPEAPGAEPGKIWTPDSELPAGQRKAAIWTPGSD